MVFGGKETFQISPGTSVFGSEKRNCVKPGMDVLVCVSGRRLVTVMVCDQIVAVVRLSKQKFTARVKVL